MRIRAVAPSSDDDHGDHEARRSALTPIAQRTIQTMRPAVVARTRPIERGSLTDEPGGKPRNELPDRGGGIVGLRGRAHEPAADDHAVGARRARRRPPARASRCRSRPRRARRACALDALEDRRGRRPRRAALAGRADDRDGVDEAARAASPIARQALVGRRRRDERDERDAVRRRRPPRSRRPPRAAGRARSARWRRRRRSAAANASGAAREDEVGVAHDHDRQAPRAARARRSSTPSTVAPARSAAVPAAWMTGPSASGSENGMPSSTRSAPPSA